MKEKILIKYTSRSRPAWFFRGLDSIIDNLYDKENYFIVCSFDEDDQLMNNQIIINKLNTYKNIVYYFGKSKSKIDAINRDIDKFPVDWDILINFSDDQVITSMFFDRIIRESFNQFYPDMDGVIHFPDQKTKAALITMSVMGRKYFERFGYIYHPIYISLYCDSEFGDVSKLIGKYTYLDIQIFKHLHPVWGLALMDAQYQQTESYYKRDGEIYRQRKNINFGLELSK